MRRLARSLRTVPASQRSFPLLSLRSLHDNGLWGFQRPRHFQVPDFSPEELANRIKHASLMRLVEMYRVSYISRNYRGNRALTLAGPVRLHSDMVTAPPSSTRSTSQNVQT